MSLQRFKQEELLSITKNFLVLRSVELFVVLMLSSSLMGWSTVVPNCLKVFNKRGTIEFKPPLHVVLQGPRAPSVEGKEL